jgi:hypothetical protein
VRLGYRDKKAEMSIGENSAVRPGHEIHIYSTHRTATERENLRI